MKNSNLADNIYGIKFSGTYKEGINESLLNGSFDFIVKEVRIKDILFKSSLASDNYDKITNALKVIMIVVLSHRNLLVTNKMFFKYRCEDLGNNKWSFRFVKSEKERVNLEYSARHFFIVQLNNQGQIETIESKSLNSQFNDDYHFFSKYKSSVEGISLEKINATFINSQNHNTLRLSLDLIP
ncbi:hypothetical protein HZP98_12255 [Elizabethkingia anophelis]|uniref:Uncharacterized protein n=1 Tax=Elizabethkingia anophelis TaxID=1117645 RepID=A0AAE4NZL9_9FLAO|nr:hypothetical protein [Elizabethkingia anophelis]MCT3920452.1 hypothetical protein [Elizabethkingia anophelis]MCT3952737.1 hypothetical protein [Elizabethkingia anophelis]MCT3956350.1 hypothetical protein [Elizabethkingia anophelis]MCT3988040.1 hypothetical protein [Elizabethkingia anophelis]